MFTAGPTSSGSARRRGASQWRRRLPPLNVLAKQILPTSFTTEWDGDSAPAKNLRATARFTFSRFAFCSFSCCSRRSTRAGLCRSQSFLIVSDVSVQFDLRCLACVRWRNNIFTQIGFGRSRRAWPVRTPSSSSNSQNKFKTAIKKIASPPRSKAVVVFDWRPILMTSIRVPSSVVVPLVVSSGWPAREMRAGPRPPPSFFGMLGGYRLWVFFSHPCSTS